MSRAPRILGAVLAGGASRRFGSDKALAPFGGAPMLEHVVRTLAPQVAEIAICGREWGDLRVLPDAGAERIGPLAGLDSALRFAAANWFDAVLTTPVDVVPLPADLTAHLAGPCAAVFDDQWLIGWWPVALAEPLGRFLATGDRRWHRWMQEAGATRVAEPHPLHNLNTRAQWAALAA